MVTTIWLPFAAHSPRLGAAAVCRKHMSFATLGGWVEDLMTRIIWTPLPWGSRSGHTLETFSTPKLCCMTNSGCGVFG